MKESIILRVFLTFALVCYSNMCIRAQLSRCDSIKTADELFAKGIQLYNSKKYNKAISTFIECDNIEKQVYPENISKRVYPNMWISACYYKLGEIDKAKSISNYYNTPIDRRLTIKSDSLAGLGDFYFNKGDLDSTLYYYQATAAIEKNNLGSDSPWYGNSIMNILNIYRYKLYYESSISLDSVCYYLKELLPVFSNNHTFRDNNTKNLIELIQPIRKLVLSLSKQLNESSDNSFVPQTFYSTLIDLLSFSRGVIFLSEIDEYYGRAIEEYCNYLVSCNRKQLALEMIELEINKNRKKSIDNANSIIINLTYGRLLYYNERKDEAKLIYYNTFNEIKNIDINEADKRIWVENRLCNAVDFFEIFNLNKYWIEIAEFCRNIPGFLLSENKDFSAKLAKAYSDSGSFDRSEAIYVELCRNDDLASNPSNYDYYIELANVYSKQNKTQESLECYLNVERQAEISIFDKESLYDSISECYNKLNDKDNYKLYRNKLKKHLYYLLENELSDSIREELELKTRNMYDMYKHRVILNLQALYFEDGELDNRKYLLDYALHYYKKIEDHSNVIRTFMQFGESYGYNGYKKLNISNDYYFKAINYCDSLSDKIDMYELEGLKGSCYGGIGLNYISLSIEPELSMDFFEKAILHNIRSLELIRNNNIQSPDIKEILMKSVFDLTMFELRQYSDVCTEYKIDSGEYLYNNSSKILEVMDIYLPEEDKFRFTFNMYQNDFDQKFIFGHKDLCKNRLEEMEKLLMNNIQHAILWDYYNIADNYIELNDTVKALYYYTNVINDYHKSGSTDDLLNNSAYWNSHKAISRIKGDQNWINRMKEEIVNHVDDMKPEKRIESLYEVVKGLSSARFGKESEDLRNYLIGLDRRIIHEYHDEMDFDHISDIYYDLLSNCIENKQYSILKDYYNECVYAGMQAYKKQQYYMPNSIFEEYQGKGLGELLSITYADSNFDNGVIYNSLLFRKNAELSVSMSLSELIGGTTDSLLLKKYQRVESLRKAIRNTNADYIEDMGRILTLNEAASIAYRFEEEIRVTSSYISDYVTSLNTKWQDVQASLNEKEIAIEFSQFKDINDKEQYAAVLLKSIGAPLFIYIGDKEKLQSVNREKGNYLSNIYDIIWKPLEQFLYDVNTIYVSPDGELHKIPFEYAVTNEKMFLDKFKIIRVSTTRNILNKNTSKNHGINNVVLYGGISYDEIGNENNVGDSGFNRGIVVNGVREAIEEINYLPGTLEEINNIKKSCIANKIRPQIYSGKSGTESSLKRKSKEKMDILHIATHGYYIPKTASVSAKTISHKDSLAISYEDLSLLRTGIIMAGVNYYKRNDNSSEEDDGLLTAYEISQMNLYNTDFVVLSACETGLGDISGEGVYGLPRGFKKAGVGCIMMSLWKVDDGATKEFMSCFYDHYLSGKSKYQSLILAQKKVRSHKYWEDPKYWASFVLLDSTE